MSGTKIKGKYSYKPFNAKLVESSSHLKKSIKPVKGDEFSYKCNICSKIYNKDTFLFQNLEIHLKSARHASATGEAGAEELTKAIAYLEEIKSQAVEKGEQPPKESKTQKNETIIRKRNNSVTKLTSQDYYRIEVANFIMKNCLSFSFADKFSKFLQKLLSNYSKDALTAFSVNRNHISEIATDVVASSLRKKYLEVLSGTPYSISIDGGAAKGKVEYLAVHARYLPSEEDTLTATKLIGLIELGKSSKGIVMYEKLKEFLFSGEGADSRKNNLMGISTDHAPNMMSSGSAGLSNRLTAEIPHAIMIYDFCHALNITLKHSKRHFPQKYLKIVEEISSHFSYPQSTASFKLFLTESQKNKVLAIKNYVETRWSSFIECLDRILELKEALETYFMQEGKSNQKQYFNSENLVMLNLFSCLANKIDYFIRYFEKDNRDMMKIVKLSKNVLSRLEFFFINFPTLRATLKIRTSCFQGRLFTAN